jgi:hypothetical protein
MQFCVERNFCLFVICLLFVVFIFSLVGAAAGVSLKVPRATPDAG